jgi:hypothetical protein
MRGRQLQLAGALQHLSIAIQPLVLTLDIRSRVQQVYSGFCSLFELVHWSTFSTKALVSLEVLRQSAVQDTRN